MRRILLLLALAASFALSANADDRARRRHPRAGTGSGQRYERRANPPRQHYRPNYRYDHRPRYGYRNPYRYGQHYRPYYRNGPRSLCTYWGIARLAPGPAGTVVLVPRRVRDSPVLVT